MGSANIQLVGNVGTEPKTSLDNPGKERVSFRVIANERRLDPTTNEWADADQFSVTVVCWGSLAKGVAQSVRLGDPVVVGGKIFTRKYESDGVTRFATEVKAAYASLDLSRGTATFRKNPFRSTEPAEGQEEAGGDGLGVAQPGEPATDHLSEQVALAAHELNGSDSIGSWNGDLLSADDSDADDGRANLDSQPAGANIW